MEDKEFNVYKYIGVHTDSSTVKELVVKYKKLQQEKAELIEWLENEIKDTCDREKLNKTLYSDVYLRHTSNMQEVSRRRTCKQVLNKIKGDVE